jgi:hypothetical protein
MTQFRARMDDLNMGRAPLSPASFERNARSVCDLTFKRQCARHVSHLAAANQDIPLHVTF